MRAEGTLNALESNQAGKLMRELYGEAGAEANAVRYKDAIEQFQKNFGDQEMLVFSSPGRTEISGNHTDHNHGKVLAGSINLDCVGIAARNHSSKVHIISETFRQKFTIDLNQLERGPKPEGTVELVKGLLKGFVESGYEIGGFDAYIVSNVISSAGVSSSAAFEMLLCSMINKFFNENRINTVDRKSVV